MVDKTVTIVINSNKLSVRKSNNHHYCDSWKSKNYRKRNEAKKFNQK